MSQVGEMKLQKEIEGCIGDLIRTAEKLVTDLGDKIKSIEQNQIRNVLAVANSAPHVAVVTNFIRYQMGRSGAPGKAWKNTGLGKAVIDAIEGSMSRIAGKAAEKSGYNVDEVQVRLTRLLLGFMNRRYVYEADEAGQHKKGERE
jgi:hypothetical protein